MWTGRILLLILLLLTGGGWFDTLLPNPKKTALFCAEAAVFGLTLLPEIRTPTVRISIAPCAFLLCMALLCPTKRPLGALLAAVFGGFLGWKLCDALPLFFEQGLLIAAAALLCMPFCRDEKAKALAIAAAPVMMLLWRTAGDYALFQSAVVQFGSGDALCAQSAGLLCLLTGKLAASRLLLRNRLHAGA